MSEATQDKPIIATKPSQYESYLAEWGRKVYDSSLTTVYDALKLMVTLNTALLA